VADAGAAQGRCLVSDDGAWRERRDARGKLWARLEVNTRLLELRRNGTTVAFDLSERLPKRKEAEQMQSVIPAEVPDETAYLVTQHGLASYSMGDVVSAGELRQAGLDVFANKFMPLEQAEQVMQAKESTERATFRPTPERPYLPAEGMAARIERYINNRPPYDAMTGQPRKVKA
jgi:hypothetical protein